MSNEVLVEYADSTIIITINRPDARNAINRAVTDGVAAAIVELESRADLTIGILTGAGGVFSAGMDLRAFRNGEDLEHPRGLAGITHQPPRKPLIAAVEGWALGGGFEIALAADLIVAASNAKFGLPEVKSSLVASGGGLLRLPGRIPSAIAMEMALTGDPLTADQALRFGLVNQLTEPDGALAGARALATRITANGPLAVAATKEIVSHALDWTIEEGFAKQDAIMQPVFASEDAREGITAFTEKRAPVWKGR